MINAEELGVTSANVDEIKVDQRPPTCSVCWASRASRAKVWNCPMTGPYSIVKQVGNYGEAFERNVGAGSPLGISRGLNALWSQGGIQYAPPIR